MLAYIEYVIATLVLVENEPNIKSTAVVMQIFLTYASS